MEPTPGVDPVRWGRRGLGEAESDDESPVEPCELVRTQPSAAADQHILGESEKVVAVERAVVVESLRGAELDLGDMTMERAGHEDAHHRAEERDGTLPGGDHDRVGTDAGDLSVPDITPADQRSLAARHAATEKADSLAIRSSPGASGSE